jgi:hypothetical protein
MALTVIKPSGIETSGNYTVNGMNVSANASVANLSVTNSANLGTVSNVKITGGTSDYVLRTDGAGNLSWVAQSGGGSSSISNGNSNINIPDANGNIAVSVTGSANTVLFTPDGITVANGITASGNITAQYFTGNGYYLTGVDTSPANISNGISNVQVYLDSNVTISVAGNANILTVTGTGINVSGNATIGTGTGGNLSGANVVTANLIESGNVNASANVNAQYFVGNGFYLTGVDTSPANVSNGTSNLQVYLDGNVTTSVAGNANILTVTSTGINVSGNATIGTGTGGNISGANIISANTFTALTSVNFVSASNVSLGAVGNVKITGGASDYILRTDGAGNLSWIAQSTGASSNISNGNSNVNIPTSNGNINLTAVGNTTMVITGTGANIFGYANITGNLVAGNANLGNLVTANYLTGTLTTNAQPNITSVGTLTDLSVSGNGVFGGNLTVNGTLTYINSTTLSISDPIINLQTGPNGAAPVANTGKDVGTALNYYDTSAKIAWMGWDISNAEIAFGSNVSISAEVVTYDTLANIRSGNANLGNLATANFFTGNVVNVSGTLNTTGNVLFTGADVSLGNVSNLHILGGTSSYVLSTDGTGNLSWVAQSGGGGGASISNGNSNVNIPTANGNVNITAVGNTTAIITGTGINVFGTLNVTGQSNLGNVGNVIITGGSSSQYLQTDGTGNLSWVSISTSSTLANGNSNVNIPVANGNVNISAVGNANVLVVTGTGANISGTLDVTGNITAGNLVTSGGNISGVNVISANTFTATGNITAGNVIGIIAAGSNAITTTGNANVGNLGTTQVLASANITAPQFISNIAIGTAPFVVTSTTQVANLNVATAGTVTTNAQPNIRSVGNLTGLTVSNATGVVNFTTTANVTLGNVANLRIFGGSSGYVLQTDGTGVLSWVAQGGSGVASISNGNSNVNIPGVNGNVNITAVGNTTAIFTGTGVNVFGTLNTGAGIITGNGNGLSSLVGANVSGQVGNSLISGTVYTNAQPNITSVGSLSGLTVSNATGIVNFTNTSNVSLGNVSNLHIAGGTSDYVLRTDGAGNLSWVAQSGGGGGGSSISNGNSNVNIATANGNITMTAVGNTIVTVTGTGANISGNLSVTGSNVSLGSNSNVKITGGTNGFVLQTDGTGNLSWGAQGTSTTSIQQFTAAAAQTTFTVSGGYSVGSVIVFVNGIQMNDGDYTATNGTTIVLTEPRVAGDIVRVVSTIAAVNMVVSQLQNFSVAMSIALGI